MTGSLLNIGLFSARLPEIFEGISWLLLWTGIGATALVCIHYLVGARWSQGWVINAKKISGLVLIAFPLTILSLLFFPFEYNPQSFSFLFWRDILLGLALTWLVFRMRNNQVVPGRFYPVLTILILFISIVISHDRQLLHSGKVISGVEPFYELLAGMQAAFALVLLTYKGIEEQHKNYYRQYFNLFNWLWVYLVFIRVLIISYADIPGETALVHIFISRIHWPAGLIILLCGFVLPAITVYFKHSFWKYVKIISLLVLAGKVLEFIL